MFERLRAIPISSEPLNLLGASAVYILLLIFPPAPYISQAVNQSGWIILLLLAVYFGLLFRKKGATWAGIQSISVFALFALLLIHQWQSADSYGEIVSGLLPWSDAASYLGEAQRLIHGSLFTTWGGGHRPLFPAFLAVLVQLTGRNFMVTLALLTWVNALALLLVVREVERNYGALGAIFLLLFATEFYIRFAGTTMTEQLGFALGNLAVFFLLIGAQNKSLIHALLGLGLLSLALNARAGAFFILPMLVLWMAITLRPKFVLWRTLGLAITVAALPFILDFILLKTLADPQSVLFSNYSTTLYGLASGNKGFAQVNTDYPNIPESEVMPLAIQKIRSDPALLLRGMLGCYLDFFKPDDGVFTYISSGSFRATVNIFLWGLTLIGLAYGILNWKEGIHTLVLASFIGIFASVALLPPIDANYMRAYAATIPFTALWVAEGGGALISRGKKLLKLKEESSIEEITTPVERLAIGFSVLLVILAVPAPILLQSLARTSNGSALPSAQTTCMPGEQSLQGSVLKNIRVALIPNEASNESYMPFIRIDDFLRAVRKVSGQYSYLYKELVGLQAGQQISVGFDPTIGNEWLISSFPVEARKLSACGKVSDNQELRPYSFYYLNGPSVRPSSLTISQQNPSATHMFRLLYGLGAGIILLLLVMDISDFKTGSIPNQLYAFVAIILVLQGVFVVLYSRAVIHLPFAEQQITLQVKDAVPEQKNLYILPLGINWMSQADLGSSPAVVYENGIPLALPNSKPKGISNDGNGRYSVSGGYLYFASSDNTDPRFNGRTYELAWPHPIQPVLQWLSYLVSLLGMAMLFFRESLTGTVKALRIKFKQRQVQL